MRQFRDASGVEWRVSFTERREASGRREHYLPEAFRQGWLLFESANEKRRLAPVPPGWESLPDEALAALCATASPGAPRRGDAPAVLPVDAEAPGGESPGEPLRPELQRVQRQLGDSIAQVCAADRVDRLDTGELIRVEESLAIAAEAAKEAVSLRRKLRADRRNGEHQPDDRS